MQDCGGNLKEDLQDIGGIANLSPAAIEILNLIDKPDVSSYDIAELVSLDRILYANIFKYINSAAFALRRSPKSIDEAIDYLGLYGLRDLIFVIASKGIFSYPENWEQSVLIAFCAKKLAQRIGLAPSAASDIYIAALVHNIGSMVLNHRYKDTYSSICDEEDLYKRLRLEKESFTMNSVEISYEILKDCGLPDSILNIIRHQDLAWCDEDYSLSNLLIELATELAQLDFADEREVDEIFTHAKVQRFGLDDFNFDSKFVRKIHHDVEDFVSF